MKPPPDPRGMKCEPKPPHRLTLSIDGWTADYVRAPACVSPSGRTDGHGAYARMVNGRLVCHFCGQPDVVGAKPRAPACVPSILGGSCQGAGCPHCDPPKKSPTGDKPRKSTGGNNRPKSTGKARRR